MGLLYSHRKILVKHLFEKKMQPDGMATAHRLGDEDMVTWIHRPFPHSHAQPASP